MADRPKRSTSLGEAAASAKDTLSPKYVPLRGDQLIELDVLAREVQAARTHKGERITANTLIRVGVDVLLAHRGQLVGDTEEELRTAFLGYIARLEETATATDNGTGP